MERELGGSKFSLERHNVACDVAATLIINENLKIGTILAPLGFMATKFGHLKFSSQDPKLCCDVNEHMEIQKNVLSALINSM
jgi:hypothetical protein